MNGAIIAGEYGLLCLTGTLDATVFIENGE
jgi:hypothetical protein